MEGLVSILASVAADNVSVTKTANGLSRVAERLVADMTRCAATALRKQGIDPSELSIPEFLRFAAHRQLEEFRFAGLLSRDPFTAPRLAAVEARLESEPNLAHAELRKAIAFCLDVLAYGQRHFVPTPQFVEMLSDPARAQEIPDPEDCWPVPCSPVAIACRDRFPTATFASHKSKVFIMQPKTMPEVLAQPFLTEAQAAAIVHLAEKTLADRRRAGEFDSAGVLVRREEGSPAIYDRDAWIEYNRPKIEPVTLPKLRKTSKKQSISIELPNLPKRGKSTKQMGK